jgi:hypothetical protein
VLVTKKLICINARYNVFIYVKYVKLGLGFLVVATIIVVVIARAKEEYYSFMFLVPLEPTLDTVLPNRLCPLCSYI